MAIKAKIDTLRVTDKDGQEHALYPRTTTKAVVNAVGKTVDQMLADYAIPTFLTQEEYNALSEEEQNTGLYVITDASSSAMADTIGYDNTASLLSSTDVQRAIDEVVGNVNNKANQEDLDNHINDAVVHITAEERTNWDSAEGNANAYTDTKIATVNESLDKKVNMRSLSSSRSVLDTTLADGQYFLANATDSPDSTMGYLTIQTYHDRPTSYRKHTWKPYAKEKTYENSLVDGHWLGWDSYALNSDLAYSKAEYVVTNSSNKLFAEKRAGAVTINFIGGFTSVISANSTTVLCTLDAKYRPGVAISKEICLRYSQTVYATLSINTDGTVVLSNHTNIPSGFAMYIHEAFIANS